MNVETPRMGQSLGLVRGLGPWAAAAIVVGGMIGQSVFLVASDMSREVGSLTKVLVAWMVGGAIVLFGAFCYAELGAAMPEAGGDYVYQSRGLGPLCGFLYGWTSSMIMKPGSAAIIAAGLLRFVGFLLPWVTRPIFSWSLRLPFQPQPYQFAFTYAQPLAALAIVIVAAMNYVGVRTVGRFQVFLTALKLAAVVLILGLGFAVKNAVAVDRSVFTLSHGALVAFLTALVPVMAAYNGFQGLGPLGGEILNPGRNLPRAAILGTSLVIFVSLLINWMYFHLLSFSQVAQSQHVASDVVALLIGQVGAKWFTIAMIISAFGALHANFLVGPRVSYAMSRDGNFFAFASHIQPTFHSPSGAVIFQGCLAALLVLTGTHQELYSYTMFATWMFLGLTAVALIRLRSAEPDLPRPFHVWKYPWTPLVFGISAFVISVNLWLVRPVRSSVGLMTILVGIPFFYYWRGRSERSSRLVGATASDS